MAYLVFRTAGIFSRSVNLQLGGASWNTLPNLACFRFPIIKKFCSALPQIGFQGKFCHGVTKLQVVGRVSRLVSAPESLQASGIRFLLTSTSIQVFLK